MKKKLVLLLLAVLIYSSLAHSQNNFQLTNEQRSWLSKANRHEKNGWTYLHIEGKPEERGFQHGYLLSKEIKEALRMMNVVWQYQTAMEWQWLVQRSAKMFTPNIDAENMEEMEGIVEGMKAAGELTTRDEIIAYNGSTEFMGYWWPLVKDSISPNSPDPKKESCSSFTVSYTHLRAHETPEHLVCR